jgi:pimeloyl-ACP methyl ester carboxylesterase
MNRAQDDAAMAAASGTQTVAAADGRTLTIAECGDPDGLPVFLLHGTPGSRFNELRWALEGEDVLAREIEQTAAGMLKRVAHDPSKVISDKVELSEADRAVMASSEHHEAIRSDINEAFRHGVWGYVDDILCLIQPWGLRRDRDPRPDPRPLRPERRARAAPAWRVARAQRAQRRGRHR